MTEAEEKKFLTICNRLKKLADKAIKSHQYEKAMAAIASCAQLFYEYNQFYTDDRLEQQIQDIAAAWHEKYKQSLKDFQADSNTVLFYDSFGLDTRGIALMYMNALAKLGYHVIYVTTAKAKGKQPAIHQVVAGRDVEFIYIQMDKRYLEWSKQLCRVILEKCPRTMFFYTTPSDVSGTTVFSLFQGKTDRFLVDLTDHAFWLGVRCNDYFIGGRDISASNQHYHRKIPKEKLIRLDVNLLVEPISIHEGLPFDVEHEPYIFSGGALYKTLGDKEHLYYKIVRHILQQHTSIRFLYAGSGDVSLMKDLITEFPGRVFLIHERKDFYYLIENAILYLNTYPMFGGMMMRYAAMAGKIPITLCHEQDADNILIDQAERKVEYASYQDLIADVDKLLVDEEYRKRREALLDGAVMTEQTFMDNLNRAIREHKTEFTHHFEEIDTSKFQREYYRRFNLENSLMHIVSKKNLLLLNDCPWMYRILFRKVFQKLKRVKR